jgi:vacuolar-type H+-ATPase subunit E/Vma4
MALKDILQKILDEASVEVSRIEDELKDEKKKLDAESKELEVQEMKLVDEKKSSALESLDRKTAAMARRETKKLLLSAKHTVMTAALEKFHEHLCELDDGAYGKILEKLFAKVSDVDGKILAPKNRVDITKKFAPSGADVVADDSVVGGFVMQSATAEVDNSFQNLVYSEFRNEVEIFFAQKLGLI